MAIENPALTGAQRELGLKLRDNFNAIKSWEIHLVQSVLLDRKNWFIEQSCDNEYW